MVSRSVDCCVFLHEEGRQNQRVQKPQSLQRNLEKASKTKTAKIPSHTGATTLIINFHLKLLLLYMNHLFALTIRRTDAV